MKHKIALLAIMLIIAASGRSFGALQVEGSDTSDVSSLPPFNFNEPDAVNFSAANFAYQGHHHHWCVVHKVGLGVMAAGGTTALIGAILISTAPSSDKDGLFPTGQALSGLGMEVLGLLATVAGAPLLIGGSIHDQRKWSVGFVGPKSNQVGIAYNF